MVAATFVLRLISLPDPITKPVALRLSRSCASSRETRENHCQQSKLALNRTRQLVFFFVFLMRNATCLAEPIEPALTECSSPGIEERQSRIHGRGVYALRHFHTGEFVTELLGERISAEESDRRAELLPADGHTFFFWVEEDLVLDCSRNGNSARYMNHHCEPNCESVVEGDRVFIYAIRPIEPGDELTYDYHLCWTGEEEQAELDTYACRCGAPTCRGTMLTPEPMSPDEF